MDKIKLGLIVVISISLLMASFWYDCWVHSRELDTDVQKLESASEGIFDGHIVKKWGERERVKARRELLKNRHPIIRWSIRISDLFGGLVGLVGIPGKICFYIGVGGPLMIVFLHLFGSLVND